MAWEKQLRWIPRPLPSSAHTQVTYTQTPGPLSQARLSPFLFLPRPFSGSSELPPRCPCLWLCYSPSSLLLNGALYGPVLSEKHDSGTRGQLPRSALLLGLRSLCSVMASRLHQGRGNLTPYNVSNIPFFPLCTSRNSLMSRLQREPQGHCSMTFS